MIFATSKVSDQPAHMRSLIRAFASRLSILWLLSCWLNTIWSFFSLKGGCTGSSDSTLVNMPHCWKSHVAAHLCFKMLSVAFLWYHHLVRYKICQDCLIMRHDTYEPPHLISNNLVLWQVLAQTLISKMILKIHRFVWTHACRLCDPYWSTSFRTLIQFTCTIFLVLLWV